MYNTYIQLGAACFSIGLLIILLDMAGVPMSVIGNGLLATGCFCAYLANKYNL